MCLSIFCLTVKPHFSALPRIENSPRVTHSIADELTVKWEKYQYGSDGDISKYLLLARPKGTGESQSIDVSKALTEYTLTGLSTGTEYNISVIVIMADGTEGLPSPYILNRTACGCKLQLQFSYSIGI